MPESRLIDAFSSDALYLPTFYNELITEKADWGGLKFNGQPNFFPDMLIYFPIYYLTENIILTGIIYSFIQNVIIILLVLGISKSILKNFNYYYPTIINLLLVCILMSGFLGTYYSLRWHLICNGYHTSAFVLSLASFYLLIKYLKDSKRIYLILLTILVFLGVFNDKIYVLNGFLPILIVTLILYFKTKMKRVILWLLLLISFAALLALYTYHFIQLHNYFSFIHQDYEFLLSKSLESIRFAGNFLLNQLLKFDHISIILLLGYVSYLVILMMLILQKWNIENKDNMPLLMFKIFAASFFIFVFFTPIFITGTFLQPDKFRYIIFIFYLAMIIIGIILSQVKSKLLVPSISTLLIIFTISVLLHVAINKNIAGGIQNTLTFKPKYVKEFENIAASENDFKLGIAGYWKARQISAFNNKNIKVYAVFYPKINPELWTSSNRYWYFRKNSSSPHKIFNFIVLNELADTTHFIDFFGNSNIKVLNSGNTYILKVPEFYFDELENKPKIMNGNFSSSYPY